MSSSNRNAEPASASQYLAFVNSLIKTLAEFDGLDAPAAVQSSQHLPPFCGDILALFLMNKKSQKLELSTYSLPAENRVQFSTDDVLASAAIAQALRHKKAFLDASSLAYNGESSPKNSVQEEIAVPVLLENQIEGVVYLASYTKNLLQQDHLEMVKTFALSLSVKIANSRTVNRLSESVQQLKEAQKVQTALYKISSVAHASRDLNELYRLLHAIVGQLIFARNIYIAIVDQSGERITFPFYIDELDPEYEDQSADFDLFEYTTLTSYLIKNRVSLLIESGEFDRVCAEKEIRQVGSQPESWLGAPFFLDDLAGAVVVQTYNKEYSYTEKDRALLEYVAAHIGDALARENDRQGLQYLALHDSLTGLPNRKLFYDRLKISLARHKRNHEHHVALFFMDLDLFKSVNDRYGHLVGDELLKLASQAIQGCLREVDTLARFGGDEFAVLLESLDPEEICLVAERIITSLQQTFYIEGNQITTSTSIGIAFAQNSPKHPDEMIGMADKAMYQAKAQAPGHYKIYKD